MEQLFNAYNYTFLNLSQTARNSILQKMVEESGAKGAVVIHNKSCKCDFVSAKGLSIPQAEIETDMIDRNSLDIKRAKTGIELLKDSIC